MKGQVADPRAPDLARLDFQAQRFFRAVPGLDQRGRLQALVAQGDKDLAPAGLMNPVGDDLQAGRHVGGALNLAGDQVKLRQAVALAAGRLGFVLDARDQAEVFDAERRLPGEGFQRLDRCLIRGGARSADRPRSSGPSKRPPAQ